METWQLSEEVSTEQKKIGYQNLYYGFSFSVFFNYFVKVAKNDANGTLLTPENQNKKWIMKNFTEKKQSQRKRQRSRPLATNKHTEGDSEKFNLFFLHSSSVSERLTGRPREKKTRTANYVCLQTINSSTFFGGSATLLHIAVSKVTLMFHNWLNFSERVDISAATLKLRTNSTP